MAYRFFDLKTQRIVGPDRFFIDNEANIYEEEYMYTGGMFEFLPQLKLRESVIAEPSTNTKDKHGTMIYFGDVIKFLLGSDEYSGVVTYTDATFGVFTHDGFVPLNMIALETIEITGRLTVDLEEMKQSQKEYELNLNNDYADTIYTPDAPLDFWKEPAEIAAPTNETDETENQSKMTDFVQDQEPTNTPVKLQRRPLAAKTINEIKHDEPHTPQFERKPMPIIEEPRKLILSEFNSEIFTVVNMTDTEIELRPISPHSNLFKSFIQKVNGNVRLQNFYKKNAIRQMTIQEANELLKRMKEARIQWPK